MTEKTLTHVLKQWEKKRGWISWAKGDEDVYLSFFPAGRFTLIAFGEEFSNRKLDVEYGRMYIGKVLNESSEAVPGVTLKFEKISENRYALSVDTSVPVKKLKPTSMHQRAINKWAEEERKKFGAWFQPEILTENVDINEILPRNVWLKENRKYLDGLARLEIGGRPIYQSVLEVQYKGMREDLVVRVKIVLPFVARADIVAGKEDIVKIRELLERIADPNVVKARVKFYTFQEYLGDQSKSS